MFKSSLVPLAVFFVSATRGSVDFLCSFGEGSWNVVGGDFYGCNAQVTIFGDSQFMGRVTGRHMSGRTNDDVEYLWVSNRNLPFIPGNITSYFKNLVGWTWAGSNLATISAADLEQFPKLLAFDVSGNNLISIDGDLFKHTPLLRSIIFTSNQIQHVGHDLIKGLNSLVTLNFGSNPCVNVNTGNNRTAVFWLNEQLPVLCPPLEITATTATTESSQECPIARIERNEFYESKIVDLNERNAKQDATINGLNDEVKELTERLVEVERRVRELA